MTTTRAVFLGLLLICVASAAEDHPGSMTQPSCPTTQLPACTLDWAPVCGSDGKTYANKCALCVARQQTGTDILIVHDGEC